MSSIQLFSIKDKVFVKRRGYPAWPALIIGIKTNIKSQPIYTVYFYGTGNYGEYKSEVLFLYEEYKYILGKPRGKQKKYKLFVEALVQIENEAKTDFHHENNVEVFMQPISTINMKQELSFEDKFKSVIEIENQSEFNSKSEGNKEEKLISESNLSKDEKVVTSRKRVFKSTNLKRKLTDVKHEVSKKPTKKFKKFQAHRYSTYSIVGTIE